MNQPFFDQLVLPQLLDLRFSQQNAGKLDYSFLVQFKELTSVRIRGQLGVRSAKTLLTSLEHLQNFVSANFKVKTFVILIAKSSAPNLNEAKIAQQPKMRPKEMNNIMDSIEKL